MLAIAKTGSGKTFLYSSVLKFLQSYGHIVLIVAMLGYFIFLLVSNKSKKYEEYDDVDGNSCSWSSLYHP